MFFNTFNPMTPEDVDSKISASPKASSCLDPVTCTDNWCFQLKLSGEGAPAQLDYHIYDSGTLKLTENGKEYDKVPYTSAEFGPILIISHVVPDTSRGWHIVMDTRTELVTAFETWFGITVPVGIDMMGTRPPKYYRDIPREVQRQYYFGYADWDGGKYKSEMPAQLHTTTNRLEGRGMLWDYCCGKKVLSYFPSIVCSIFSELDDPRDTISVTYPSDYIRIDDEYYIYAKWGVEFGGEMWLEVLNNFDLKSAGFTFGFDKNDDFVYEFHCADLTITGDAAHLEAITDNGDKGVPMPDLKGHGARYAYRPRDYDPPMTHEEAYETAKTQRIFESGPNIMSSGNTLPYKYDLVGKQFKLTYDHVRTPYPWSGGNMPDKLIRDFEYDFSSKETLKWRAAGGEWHEERYICFEPAKDIYFFSHMITGDTQYSNVAHAVDFSTGLTTAVWARIGTWTSEWEVGATVMFGYAEGEGIAPYPFSKRHDFTTDLVGKTVAWNYSETMSSIHVYSSPESYSWTIFTDNNAGGATWSSPCFYIKLRDDAYLFEWVEENCNGSQGLVIYNPKIAHDGGFFFGFMGGTLNLNVTGAYARLLGTYDVKKYF